MRLSWGVARAESLSVRAMDSSPIFVADVGDPKLSREGSIVIHPRTSSEFILEVASIQGTAEARINVSVAPSGAEPTIQRFAASAYALDSGEGATLEWLVTGAHRVTIAADNGADGDAIVDTSDPQSSIRGSVGVHPAATTSYTLTAYGTGGTSSALLRIELPESLAIIRFGASESTTTERQEIALSWRTVAATTVHISDSDGAQVFHAAASDGDSLASIAGGVVYVAPLASTEYWLVATDATDQAQSVVQVQVVGTPDIISFTATPPTPQPGASVTVAWHIANTSFASLSTGEGVVFSQTEPTLTGGTFDTVIESDVAFTLLVRNDAGYSVTQRLDVDVVKPELVLEAWPNVSDSDTIVDIEWSSDSAQELKLTTRMSYGYTGYAIEVVEATAIASIASSGTAVSDFLDGENTARIDLGFVFATEQGDFSDLYFSQHGYVTFGAPVDLPAAEVSRYTPLPANAYLVAAAWPKYPYDFSGATFFAQRRGAAPSRELVVEWRGLVGQGSAEVVHFQLTLFEDGRILRKTDRRSQYHPTVYTIGFHTFSSPSTGFLRPFVEEDTWGIFEDINILYDFVTRGLHTVPQSGTRKFAVRDVSFYDERPGFWLSTPGAGVSSTIRGRHYTDLMINEVMINPSVPDVDGEWIEIHNFGPHDLRIVNLVLIASPSTSSSSNLTTAVFPGRTLIPAGAYVVLGANADPDANGGFHVDLEYAVTSTLYFDDVATNISIGFRNDLSPWHRYLHSVWVDDTFPVVEGASMMLGPAASREFILGNSSQRSVAGHWCASVASVASGDKGTAGAPNGVCVVGDICEGAEHLNLSAGSVTISGTTERAADDWSPAGCGADLSAPDVVYTVTLSQTQLFTVFVDSSTAAQPRTPHVYLYDVTCPSAADLPVACGSYSDSSAFLERNLPAGTYALVVDSIADEAGTPGGAFELVVTAAPPLRLIPTMSQEGFIPLGSGSTEHALPGDDGYLYDVPVGFEMPLFGRNLTHFSIASNGYIAASGGLRALYSNSVLPTQAQPDGMLAPMWDDLVPGPMGSIRTQLFTEPSQHFVVEWRDFDFVHGGSETPEGASVEFQVVLFATGVVEFRYGNLLPSVDSDRAFGGRATVGVESSDGNLGTTWSFNAPSVQAGDVIRWQP